jgi:hypothetical protein
MAAALQSAKDVWLRSLAVRPRAPRAAPRHPRLSRRVLTRRARAQDNTSAKDLAYEEDVLRNPYSLKNWLFYLEFKAGAPPKARHRAPPDMRCCDRPPDRAGTARGPSRARSREAADRNARRACRFGI